MPQKQSLVTESLLRQHDGLSLVHVAVLWLAAVKCRDQLKSCHSQSGVKWKHVGGPTQQHLFHGNHCLQLRTQASWDSAVSPPTERL